MQVAVLSMYKLNYNILSILSTDANSAADVIMEDMDEVDPEDEMQVELHLRPSVTKSTPSEASGDISRGSSRDPGPSYHLERDSMGSTSRSSLLIPNFTSPANSRSQSRTPEEWYPVVASEERQFRVLYVPDPSRAEKRAEAEANLGWTKRDITLAHYDAIKHLSGFVHKLSENKRGIKVLISEWVIFNVFPLH